MKPFSVILCAAFCAAFQAGCDSGRVAGLPPTTNPPPTNNPNPNPPAPGPSGSLTPPFRGKVAFISRRNAAERDAVFVMNPDGSQATEVPLTYPDGSPLNLRLRYRGNHFMNAKGTHFVFTVLAVLAGNANEGRTYLFNADGSNPRDITALADPAAGTSYSTLTSDVSLNADGSRLIFAYGGFGANESGTSVRIPFSIFTMRTDGSERTARYTVPSNDMAIASPVFAPDGETVYFL